MRKWTIVGYDSTRKIFEGVAPGNFSEAEVTNMLARLSSRDLAPQEVIDASKRRNHRGYKPLLEANVDWHGKAFTISVGTNPYYIASKLSE